MTPMTRTGFQRRTYGAALQNWFECPQCGEGVWSEAKTETCDCEPHLGKVWEIGPTDMDDLSETARMLRADAAGDLTPEEETFLRFGTTSTPDRRSVEL